MRVTSSVVDLQGRADSGRFEVASTSVRLWRGRLAANEARAAPVTEAARAPAPVVGASDGAKVRGADRHDEVGLSSRARELAAAHRSGSDPPRTVEAAHDVADPERVLDPKLQLLIAFVERLSGRKVELMDPSAAAPEPNAVAPVSTPSTPPAAPASPVDRGAGWGLEIVATRAVGEWESAEFRAAGTVRTEDGREIRFDTSLSMSHEAVRVESVTVRAGDAAAPAQDPLVLNFGGQPISLTGERRTFDLDADGVAESIPVVSSNGALLTLDRNANGVVDDGSELFGPRTGNGFAELAELDADRNGWIDEADPEYVRLGVWFPGGEAIETLRDRSVGAIYVGAVETPFRLHEPSGTVGGQVRSTGVWLDERGGVGTIQHVDLVTA